MPGSAAFQCDENSTKRVIVQVPANILVVEDNDLARRNMVIFFTARGYEVLEAQRGEEAVRLSALATTAAVFAHGIANPLNGIGMSVQLVAASLDGQEVNPLLRESIVKANKEIARLSALLREFRTFARTQFINLQSTDVSLLVKEILSLEMLLFSAAKVQVKTDFACLPPIMLDRDKTKQAFLNIVKNAVEAMPGGGCVTRHSHS